MEPYPNHIDFPQFSNSSGTIAKPTGIYSSKDLDFSRPMAFACKTFYTAGRARCQSNLGNAPYTGRASVFLAREKLKLLVPLESEHVIAVTDLAADLGGPPHDGSNRRHVDYVK